MGEGSSLSHPCSLLRAKGSLFGVQTAGLIDFTISRKVLSTDNYFAKQQGYILESVSARKRARAFFFFKWKYRAPAVTRCPVLSSYWDSMLLFLKLSEISF